MQLSQLEKAVWTSETLFLASLIMSLLCRSAVMLRTTIFLMASHTLGRRLLAMATSTEGISAAGQRRALEKDVCENGK